MQKVKIFDKYIFKQVLGATAVCILLFLIIWIAPETLFKIIQRVLNGHSTIYVAIQLLIFEIPKILNKALPIGIFLGALFTFDKLSKDSEITIFRSVGLSFWRILTPVIVLGSIITILCFLVNDTIGPYSCNRLLQLRNEYGYSNFVYSIKDAQNRPEKIIILPGYSSVGVSEPVVMSFADLHYNDTSILSEIFVGDTASIKPDSFIITLGKKYSIDENGIFKEIKQIENYKILEGEQADKLYKLSNYKLKRDRDMSNKQLLTYIKLLKEEQLFDEYRDMSNKYMQRYFHSFMCVLFAILGCILGFSQPREQRLIGFTVAIVITFLYYITLPFTDMLAEKGILEPLTAAAIHPVLLIVVIILAKKIKDL